jgi:hypothetical protein
MGRSTQHCLPSNPLRRLKRRGWHLAVELISIARGRLCDATTRGRARLSTIYVSASSDILARLHMTQRRGWPIGQSPMRIETAKRLLHILRLPYRTNPDVRQEPVLRLVVPPTDCIGRAICIMRLRDFSRRLGSMRGSAECRRNGRTSHVPRS